MKQATIRSQKDMEALRDTSLEYGSLFFKYNPYSRQLPQAPPRLTKADKKLFTDSLSALYLEKVGFADNYTERDNFEHLRTLRQLLE